MSITQKRMTAADLLELPRGANRYELIEGELIEMAPAGYEHGRIAMRLAISLGAYVLQAKLGEVFAAETGFTISQNPDTVRAPDLAFVGQERLKDLDNKGYFPGAPDLAVEVISPGDIYMQVEVKVGQWLAAGTRAVVIVNPRQRSIKIHRSATDVTILTEKDTLTLPELFAEWQLKVTDIFD